MAGDAAPPAAAAAALAAPPAAAATPLMPCAAALTRFAAVPESSSRTVWLNQSLTPRTASEVMPLSYHGTRSDQLALSCSSRKICRSLDSRMIGWAAILATKTARCLRLASIAALVGSSFATSVFCGKDGTMMPSVVARSCFHSHSKSLYLRVTHPLTFVYPDRVLQYVTLYSTCLLIPSPARCGSDTSI